MSNLEANTTNYKADLESPSQALDMEDKNGSFIGRFIENNMRPFLYKIPGSLLSLGLGSAAIVTGSLPLIGLSAISLLVSDWTANHISTEGIVNRRSN